jgi:SAM-dependent methyltransferase
MGRFSRALGRVFVDWLRPPPGGHWLEVGCGTGALTAALCELCQPASVLACDPAAAFISHARRQQLQRCTFEVLPAGAPLPTREGGFDAVVSGLVLNFVPQPAEALAMMRQRACTGGTVAAYVWDYDGGVEFLRIFWEAVVAADPGAAALDEAKRFGAWQTPLLLSLFRGAGLVQVQAEALELPTAFASFDDYWKPFLGGTGPAPSYVTSLDPARREQLRARLQQRLLAGRTDGPLLLRARALAVRGVAA